MVTTVTKSGVLTTTVTKSGVLTTTVTKQNTGFSLPYEIDFTAESDGALPAPWIGSATMAVSSGQVVNTGLALGSELLTNGSMEAGDPPTSWDPFGSATLASEADERTGGAGSASISITRNGTTFMGAKQTATLAAGRFFRNTGWIRNVDASSGINLWITNSSQWFITVIHQGTTWETIIRDGLTTAANPKFYLASSAAVDGQSGRGDDFSLKEYTDKSELFSGVVAFESLLTVKAGITTDVLGGTFGLLANTDSLSDPQNCILAWYSAADSVIGAAKCVAGTWSTLFNETWKAYAAGALLEIRHPATNTYQIFYNTTQVGSDLTVSDAGIVSNTLHGVYAGETGASGGINGFYCHTNAEQIIFAVGDSKTADDPWITNLASRLSRSSQSYAQHADNYGAGGATVATMKSFIDGNLGDVTGTANLILVNLGSNDLSSLPAENDWKTNYRSIIESLRAKWAAADIYLAKPLQLQGVPASTPHADTTTMHGWIDDLVGEYAYVYTGLDETDLEGGDGYVTNFVDNIHYTDTGEQNDVPDLWNTAIT